MHYMNKLRFLGYTTHRNVQKSQTSFLLMHMQTIYNTARAFTVDISYHILFHYKATLECTFIHHEPHNTAEGPSHILENISSVAP